MLGQRQMVYEEKYQWQEIASQLLWQFETAQLVEYCISY